MNRGVWVVQSVKCLTLGFPSGHVLTVHELKPPIRLCTGSMESAWDPLSLSLSLSQNKYTKKIK